MQLGKEVTVIALGFYLIRGKLRLIQTSVNVQLALTYLQHPPEIFLS